MKLLFVHPASRIFGSEKSLLGLLDHAVEFVPEVVCPPGSELSGMLQVRGIRVYELEFGKYSLARCPFWHLGMLLRLMVVFRRAQPDAIVINLEGNTLLVVLAARLMRLPVVRFSRFEFSPPSRWVEREGWLASQAIICPSKLVRSQVVAWAPDWFKDRVFHIYNPHSITLPKESERWAEREELGLNDGWVVGVFGRLHPGKRIETVIDAIAVLSERMPNIRLLVVGTHEDSPAGHAYAVSLREQADRRRIGALTLFLGYRQDVPLLLSICDVCVLASESESFGRVLVEAWAVEVPTIASNVGGCREITLASGGGQLFPVGDVDALTEKLTFLLAHPEAGLEYGKRGRAWVEANCAPTTYAEKFGALIKGIRARKP